MTFRLSLKADADLFDIYITGVRLFGAAQAERYYAGLEATFAFLSEFPRAAQERPELSSPVRVHPYKSHVVLYAIEADGVVILSIRHGHEDWKNNGTSEG